jgi:hypothetical protein
MLVRARKVHEVTAENRPSRRNGFVVAEPGRSHQTVTEIPLLIVGPAADLLVLRGAMESPNENGRFADGGHAVGAAVGSSGGAGCRPTSRWLLFRAIE